MEVASDNNRDEERRAFRIGRKVVAYISGACRVVHVLKACTIMQKNLTISSSTLKEINATLSKVVFARSIVMMQKLQHRLRSLAKSQSQGVIV